ncbi:MAG: hypothetical protein ACRDZ4_02245 [Egibacteraceae bacterium]
MPCRGGRRPGPRPGWLPGLDRFEVCRRLRERSGVFVIMLTARGEAVERICGRELRADDYCGR